jgi:hypothetical protein
VNTNRSLLLILSLAAGLLSSLSQAAAGDTAGNANKPVTLNPGGMHEKCMVLSPPQKLQYNFTASKAVDFNLHYHKGDQAYYPIREQKLTSDEGQFAATARNDYCMMWENKSTSSEVELEYEFKVVR